MKFELKMIAFLLLGLLLFQISNAARPFTTDDAGLVTKNEFEWEMGIDFLEEHTNWTTGFKHGITDSMDFGINFGVDNNSATPLSMGLKYSLWPDKIALAVTKLDYYYKLNAIYTGQFNWLIINANIGCDTYYYHSYVTYSFSMMLELDKIILGAELGGFEEELYFWTAGLSYNFLENLALDVSVTGDFESEMNLTTNVGFCFGFTPVKGE